MKRILLIILLLLSASLVLLERLSPFYINDALIHYAVIFVFLSTFGILAAEKFFKRTSTKYVLSIVLISGLLAFGKYYLSWRGTWKTQTVLFENTTNPKNTIDFQMRADKVSFGYKKRVIERLRITPYADWSTNIDTTNLDPSEWVRVNREVNEMGLKDENFSAE